MMNQKLNLIDKITKALPQLQCKKCEYKDCQSYAKAIVNKNESLDKCEPGLKQTEKQLKNIIKGEEKIITNEIKNYQIATIDEEKCIGCTICIKVCPVDAIIGAKLQKHFVINQQCNGCELCITECPVDCMEMVQNLKNLSWVWPGKQAEDSKNNYYSRLKRLETIENEKKIKRDKLNQKYLIEEYLKEAIKRESKKRKEVNTYG